MWDGARKASGAAWGGAGRRSQRPGGSSSRPRSHLPSGPHTTGSRRTTGPLPEAETLTLSLWLAPHLLNLPELSYLLCGKANNHWDCDPLRTVGSEARVLPRGPRGRREAPSSCYVVWLINRGDLEPCSVQRL